MASPLVIFLMILTYRDKLTEAIASGQFVRAFQGFDRQAYKRLEILAAATNLNDLRGLPSNRLEALRGDRAGQYSIRVNGAVADLLRVASGRLGTIECRDRRLPLREASAMPRQPIHPGEILGDELKEIGVSANQLALQLNVPQNRISQIIAGKRAITGDTALRLGHWFRNSAEFWLNLQLSYELRQAEQVAGTEIEALPVRPETAAKQSNR
jgi:antitoxin HigA-1